jgi:transposase
MVQAEYIRWLYYQQHLSIRAIAKKVGSARKTVRKIIALADARDYKYTKRLPRPCPVMGPVMPVIQAWLKEDENRPRKQRHTARRIYCRLKEEYGFKGSEESVRRAVRLLRQQAQVQPAYIPLSFALGEAAQCDWGEAQILLGADLIKVYLFVMRLCASRALFVRAYLHQNQEAFLEGHRLAFEFFGGVPKRVIYDNLKVAVKKVLEGTRREEQEGFSALRFHYVFSAEFCNVNQAHEKGQVENGVGFARRNFLVPVPQVSSLEELNAYLEQRCREYAQGYRVPDTVRTVAEVWEEEKKALLPLPEQPFACCRRLLVRSDRYSRVCFETNRYSVPTALAGKTLSLRAYVDRVEILNAGEVVAVHPRSYGRGQEILDPVHYLPELAKKPRAWKNARPLKAAKLSPVYEEALSQLKQKGGEGVKEFARIMELEPLFGRAVLTRALESALSSGVLSLAAVRECAAGLVRSQSEQAEPRVKLVAPAEPHRYDLLLGVRR